MSRVTFDNLPGFLKRCEEAANVGLTRMAQAHANLVKASFTKGPRFGSSAPGMPPNRRRSILMGAIKSTRSTNLHAVSGVEKRVPYGRILEYGGWVKSKGRLLTVPLNDKAARMREKSMSLRAENLVMISRKGKPPLLVERASFRRSYARLKRGAKGGVHSALLTGAAFILVPRVLIRARPYLRPALEKNRQALIDGALEAARAHLRKAGVA